MFIFGPELPRKDKNYGGAVVLYDELLKQLILNKISFNSFDTNKSNYSNFLSYIAQLTIFLFINRKALRNHKVFINSSSDYLYLVPAIKLFAPKSAIILRKFGSEIKDTFEGRVGILRKTLCRFVLRNLITSLYLETKYLCSYFSDKVDSVFWFPNVRSYEGCNFKGTPECKGNKIIFIGHLKKEKGILDIIDIAECLPNYEFHIYGKDCEGILDLPVPSNLKFMGVLEREEVFSTIEDYDIFLLPSYKEGYPGVIVESLLCSVPVVSTSVGGIPEMINGKNGILCEPGDISAFKGAILNVMSSHSRFSQEAYKSSKLYNSTIVTKRIISHIYK